MYGIVALSVSCVNVATSETAPAVEIWKHLIFWFSKAIIYLSSSENINGIILTCWTLPKASEVVANLVASELVAKVKPVADLFVSVTVITFAAGLATVKSAWALMAAWILSADVLLSVTT